MTVRFKWSERSLRELDGTHPDLRMVCDLALKLSPVDFIITDGLRTLAEQRAFVAKGASRTMHSRHLTGHAVDFVALVAGKVRYDKAAMTTIAGCFKQAAKTLGVEIRWGGDWKGAWDMPHIELFKGKYP